MAKVAILGGGVAGLSAAHELVERGFEVVVYEYKDIWGGKARSMGKPGSGSDGRKDLPGEHGFRFFPGFYKHLPDTMKRIPYGNNAQGVFDNLVGTTQIGLLQETGQDIVMPSEFPTTLADWKEAMNVLFQTNYGLPHTEVEVFVHQLVVILTSCQERRLAEYEKIPWWDFIQAETCSDQYKKLMGKGLTRSLVAMRAEIASTRTVGDILIQLILNSFNPGVLVDRVLKGPTNDVWIHPWIDYLKQKNVKLHLNAKTTRLNFDGNKITSATVEIDGSEQDVQADYYICAVPVEVMRRLLTDPIKQAAPSLAHLDKLNTDWMNGIQFYLAKDTPVNRGHAIYLDSPWALTSISQTQFWAGFDLDGYGDGQVRGILSIDISAWDTPGHKVVTKAAQFCSPEEIKDEVWAQVKAHLNEAGKLQLEDAHLLDWHLDPSIVWPREHHENQGNAEPLLINTVDSWQHRPEAKTDIPNLLLASDYVRTYTDLATMEGANEAARRAVNAILDAENSTAPRCELWPLHEPLLFAPLRQFDWLRFKLGLPHGGWVFGIILASIVLAMFVSGSMLAIYFALRVEVWGAVIAGAVAVVGGVIIWFTLHIILALVRVGRRMYTHPRPNPPPATPPDR